MARETHKVVRFKMTFPQSIVGEPIMTRLSHDFSVSYNMMRGRITDKGAWLEIELAGTSRNVEKALKYLKEMGVAVQKLEG